MTKYEGIVNVVTEKAFPSNGRMAAATLYGTALRGVDGFFSLPKNQKPTIAKGDYVEFMADDKKKIDIATLRVIPQTATSVAPATGGTVPAAATSVVPYAPPATNVYAQREVDRNKSIVFQSSRKDAIELVGLMLSQGALKLPVKEAAKQEAILAYVEEYTNRFYLDVMNVHERQTERDEPVLTGGSDEGDDEDSFGK